MIKEATLQVAADGGILVILPRTGMDLAGETRFCVRDGHLRVGQGGRCFVSAALENQSDADLVIGNLDVSVVEVDDAGMEFHGKVREATT